MEFSALAAKETSALLTRVLGTASDATLERVAALRAALDQASRALEAAAAPPDVERDVDELVKRLTKAAAAEADARLKHLSAEARKITDALRAELADVIGEKDALGISLKDARAQLETLRGQLAAEQKQAQSTLKELAEANVARKDLTDAYASKERELADAHASKQKELAQATAARDKEASARSTAEGEVQSLKGQLETARKDAKRAAADAEAAVAEKRKAEVALSAANSQAQAAEAKLSAVTTLFKTSAARVQALEREQEQQAARMRELEAGAACASGDRYGDLSGRQHRDPRRAARGLRRTLGSHDDRRRARHVLASSWPRSSRGLRCSGSKATGSRARIKSVSI